MTFKTWLLFLLMETALSLSPGPAEPARGAPLDIRALPRQTSAMNPFFKRLFLADFWKGMILTFRTQNPKNIYTEQYPLERPMVAERYRGAPRLNMNPETGETLCISCNLCALACPENLIVVGWHRDDATLFYAREDFGGRNGAEFEGAIQEVQCQGQITNPRGDLFPLAIL